MTDIERVGENTSALVKTGEAMMTTIDERVASLLPAVVDQDGSVDWGQVRLLPVASDVGSLVVARSIPELILDESRRTDRLEAAGRIEEALDHRNYVQALQSGSAYILERVNEVLFDTQEYTDRMQTTTVNNEDGTTTTDRLQKAASIMDFSDALMMQMQGIQFNTSLNTSTDKYEIESEQLVEFLEEMALPAAKLARDGMNPETAFSVLQVERVTGIEIAEILKSADYLHVDINDDRERNKLAFALATVESFEDLQKYVDPNTGEFTLLSKDDELDEIELQADTSLLPRRMISDELYSDEESDDFVADEFIPETTSELQAQSPEQTPQLYIDTDELDDELDDSDDDSDFVSFDELDD